MLVDCAKDDGQHRVEQRLCTQHGQPGAGSGFLHQNGRQECIFGAFSEQGLEQWCKCLSRHVVDIALDLQILFSQIVSGFQGLWLRVDPAQHHPGGVGNIEVLLSQTIADSTGMKVLRSAETGNNLFEYRGTGRCGRFLIDAVVLTRDTLEDLRGSGRWHRHNPVGTANHAATQFQATAIDLIDVQIVDTDRSRNDIGN